MFLGTRFRPRGALPTGSGPGLDPVARPFAGVVSAVVLLLGAVFLGAVRARAAAPPDADSSPRVIVLGFDGVDHRLAKQFMDEGDLPNLKALADEGSFVPLETTNPAESAVSWSTFGRGLNPGKTDMMGFVRRKPGTYLPDLGFMKLGEKPLADFYDARPAQGSPQGAAGSWPVALALLVIGLLAGFGLGKRLGGGSGAGILLALLLGGGGGAAGWWFLGGEGAGGGGGATAVPEEVPTLLPVVKGDTLWGRADRAGLRVRGFLVPMSTPIEPLQHGKIVGGLGVPDITGSIGAWYMLSSSDKDVPVGDDRKLNSGGKMLRLREENGVFVAQVPGPKNESRKAAVVKRLQAVDAKLRDFEISYEERAKLRQEKNALEEEKDAGFRATLPMKVRRREDGKSLEIDLGGDTKIVAEGEWSGWFRIHFPLDWPFDGGSIARLRVLSAGDPIKLFLPPLGFDPAETPKHMQMEWPPGYSAQLAKEAGLFDTVGWACINNPLKELEVDEGVFLEHIRMLTEERSRLVYHELEKGDFDLFLTLFGETDRVQHMMFRLTDPKSPTYDAALAAKYGDAIRDVYRAMDGIVGEVMRRFVDDRTVLLVVSDHGFTSFRRQVNLNTWLLQEGYLVPQGGGSDAAALYESLPESRRDFLLYMDKSRSRAFALGLGKIYINLRGREASGIVDPADYDSLCEEIKQKLLALRDPADGAKVVRRVWRQDEIYRGPYADSDADLFLGFAPYYRVGWATTTGGFTPRVIEDNPQKWSGDHVSNDPAIVPGILVTNRPLAVGATASVVDMAPTILSLLEAPVADMDGKPLTFR